MDPAPQDTPPHAPGTGAALAERLLHLINALRAATSVESALRSATETANALTGSDQSSLRLVDAKRRALLLASRSGAAMHRGGGGRFSLKADSSLLAWCVDHAESACINDVERDPRFRERAGQTWMPTALLISPLRGRHGIIGVLSTARRDDTPYTASDLQMLDLIAAVVTPHVEVELLSELAETDALTLLRNRRHLARHFAVEFASALRHGRPLSAIALDLDHLKHINDRYGHPVGDEVLVELGRRTRAACRPSDVVARIGGDEFLLLLPETKLEEASGTARRIVRALEGEPIQTQAGPLLITVSAGVCAAQPTDDLSDLIKRADDLLFDAKRAGRNQVAVES